MLVFTKLLFIFGIMLLIVSVALYIIGVHASGNTYLNYYPNAVRNESATTLVSNFVQNGLTTIKYLAIFAAFISLFLLIGAATNEHWRLSEKLHHLKHSRPSH